MKGFCRALLITFVICCSSLHGYGNVEEVLQRLACRSRESSSDSVLITSNGRVIFEYRADPFWQPLETHAITKSVASLAIGMLIDEGKIDSVDAPIYTFYPEWNQGNKKFITLRHILTHTSGLQADNCKDDFRSVGNIVQWALSAELSTFPGSNYFYNDKAVNLISGIVKQVSGKSLSEYLAVKLFAPLGIENVSWLSDSCGNEYAMSHMMMTAPDLNKIGELIAHEGFYGSRPFLSKTWINLMTQPGCFNEPFYGMLWWMDYYNVACWWDEPLLQQYACSGINPYYIDILRSLNGRVMDMGGCPQTARGYNFFSAEMTNLLGGDAKVEDFIMQARNRHLPIARWRVGALKSISARGLNGQQLIVFPNKKVVAIRQTRDCQGKDPFHDFGYLVEELTYRMGL